MFTLKKGDGGLWELWVWAVFGTEVTFPEVFRLVTKEPKEEFYRRESGGTMVVIRDPEAGRTYVLTTSFEGDNSYSHVEVVDDPTYTPGAVPCPTV